MKFRNSFVTNSSSSSFVIAVRDGMSKEDIKKELKRIIPEKELNAFCEYQETTTDEVLTEMTYILKTRSDYGLKICDFNIGADYWYDGGEALGETAIQEFGIDSENIKVSRGY